VSRLTWDYRSASPPFRLRALTLCGPPFQTARLQGPGPNAVPLPRRSFLGGLAFSAFARHYSRNRVCFLLLEVLRCFTSLGSLRCTYEFSAGYGGITRRGFPHSDIAGSSWLAASPTLFRSYPRLLRLLSPRHPSCALCSLVISLPSSFNLLFEKTRVQRGSVVNRNSSPNRHIIAYLRICSFKEQGPVFGLSKPDSKPRRLRDCI